MNNINTIMNRFYAHALRSLREIQENRSGRDDERDECRSEV